MARHGGGRSLLAFFVENRPKLVTEILRAAEGIIVDRTTLLRPRDRRPQRVRIDSALPHEPGGRVQLRWINSPRRDEGVRRPNHNEGASEARQVRGASAYARKNAPPARDLR